MHTHILTTICTHYKIEQGLLTTKEQRRQVEELVNVKQVAAYLLWKYTRLSNAEIASLLGYKDRRMTNWGRRQVKLIMGANKAYCEEITTIENSIIRH